MEAVWQWGINLIIVIQQAHSPVLDSLFGAITLLGGEQFYLILFPLILWCIDYSFGAVLAVFFMISNSINIILKGVFQHPRPFELNPGVRLSYEEGFGLPSGHAQMAVTAWGAIAFRVRKVWFSIIAVLLILLIGFSRIYLGVHFPTDVFAGWIIGLILLAVYLAVESPVEKWLSRLNMWLQLLVAVAVTLLLLLLNQSNDAITSAGTLFGISVGLVFAHRYISFDVQGVWWHRVLRFLIGFVVVLALYLGLKAAFPPDGALYGGVFRFLRYALIGVWIVLGAPWLFRFMRLAPASK